MIYSVIYDRKKQETTFYLRNSDQIYSIFYSKIIMTSVGFTTCSENDILRPSTLNSERLAWLTPKIPAQIPCQTLHFDYYYVA